MVAIRLVKTTNKNSGRMKNAFLSFMNAVSMNYSMDWQISFKNGIFSSHYISGVLCIYIFFVSFSRLKKSKSKIKWLEI